MARGLFPSASEFLFGSDEKTLEKVSLPVLWIREYIKDISLSSDELQELSKKYEINYDEIIARCRYLRNINKEQAIWLIYNHVLAWRTLLEKNAIDIVYCLPIDSYVLHCLYIVCKTHEVKFFSLVGTFFHNRIRLTNFGELTFSDQLNETGAPIAEFIDKVRETAITPDWLIGVNRSSYKTIIIRFLVDSIKPALFQLYRFVYNDKFSYSFPPRQLLKKRMFSTLNRGRLSLQMEKQAVDISKLSNFVFIPLQFYPEVTSDYWNENIKLINHHQVVLSTVDSLGEKDIIVIKEHPAALGRRDDDFIRKLLKKPNVFFAPTQWPMNDLLKRSRMVIGNASTTTVNAIILNKPVIFFSKPYFDLPEPAYFSEPNTAHMSEIIEKYQSFKFDQQQIRNIVNLLYYGSAEGNLGGYTPIGEKVNNASNVICTNETLRYVNNYLNL